MFFHIEHLLTTQKSLTFRKGSVGNADLEKCLAGTIHNLKISYNNKTKQLIYFVCNKIGQIPKGEKQ